MDLNAQLGTVFKIYDQQNIYWGQYLFVNGTLVGWLVVTERPPHLPQILPVILIYAVFVVWNMSILRTTYGIRSAAVDELEALVERTPPLTERFRTELLRMQKDDWPRDRMRHLAIDTLVVLFMLWRAAR